MSRLRSFITLVWLIIDTLGRPLDEDEDDEDDGCGSESVVQPHIVLPATASTHTAGILAPYRHPSLPHLTPSQPTPHPSETTPIVGTVIGIVIALAAFFVTARYLVYRRTTTDPAKPRSFVPFRFQSRSVASKKRLSDESWVSPALPTLGSPVSPLSQDLDLRQYALSQRKLVSITTPVCTPTDTEFGISSESSNSPAIPVPPVRVPSPVYISPFSPSPSLTSSSSLSPAPSTEPLSSPSPNPARLSRLLSSTFRDSRVSPARPTTAHLIHTARAYAHAYRPSCATTTSLYTQPSARLSGTRSRTGFYPGQTDDARTGWGRVRDTFSTVTTSDTVSTIPHLLHAVNEARPSASPFADPYPGNRNQRPASPASSMLSTITEGQEPVGTWLGQKLRLSDASEHARYRLRERERQQERERKREGQRVSTDSRASTETTATVRAVYRSLELDLKEVSMTKEFRLRDSERVLREIGW